MNEKWDKRFLEQARLQSTYSKDPSTQTGAVIVRPDKTIVSQGYNGFARGVQDLEDRYLDRSTKYEMVIHCEENAILFADRHSLVGSCLYTWPFMSCSRCAAKVIQVGIKRVVSIESYNSRWINSFCLSKLQFKEANVDVILYPSNFLV